MAGGDYRLCDVCNGKTFYDANLNYERGPSQYRYAGPYRVAGKPQFDDPDLCHRVGNRLDYLGDWAVICDDCAKTHETVIRKKEAS